MGHVIQNLIIELIIDKVLDGSHAVSNEWFKDFSLLDKAVSMLGYDYLPNTMKSEIVKIAKEKFGAESSIISGYGETNNKDWFAESFEHLQCTSEEKLSPLGKAMCYFLSEKNLGDIINNIVPKADKIADKYIVNQRNQANAGKNK